MGIFILFFGGEISVSVTTVVLCIDTVLSEYGSIWAVWVCTAVCSVSVEAGGRSFRRTGWNQWNGVKQVVSICLMLFQLFYSSHCNEPVLL